MSSKVVFVLHDSSSTSTICGVFSSLELAKKAMNEIVVEIEDTDELYLHIFEVPLDSFERIETGWNEVAGFSSDNIS